MASKLPEVERYYSVKEVAAMFNVGMFTVRSWIKGEHGHPIMATKTTKGFQISHSEVERLANLLYGESK